MMNHDLHLAAFVAQRREERRAAAEAFRFRRYAKSRTSDAI